MSGLCLQQFDLLSEECWQRVVKAQFAIDEHRRPSMDKVEIVGRIIAGGVIDEVGYCDLTYEQIAAKSWNISVSRVKPCIKVWSDSGLLITTRRSSKGQNGEPGRAPRRVFTFYDPQGLINKPESQIQTPQIFQVERAKTKAQCPPKEPESYDIAQLETWLLVGNKAQKILARAALGEVAEVGQF